MIKQTVNESDTDAVTVTEYFFGLDVIPDVLVPIQVKISGISGAVAFGPNVAQAHQNYLMVVMGDEEGYRESQTDVLVRAQGRSGV